MAYDCAAFRILKPSIRALFKTGRVVKGSVKAVASAPSKGAQAVKRMVSDCPDCLIKKTEEECPTCGKKTSPDVLLCKHNRLKKHCVKCSS